MLGSTSIAMLRAAARRPQTWLGLGLWWLAWTVLRVSSPLAIASASSDSNPLAYDVVFVSAWLGSSVALASFARFEAVVRRASRAQQMGLVLLIAAAFALAHVLAAAAATALSLAAIWRALGTGGLVAAFAFPALVAALLCSAPRLAGARGLVFWSSALAWSLTTNRSAWSDGHVPVAPFLPILGLALALGTLSLPARERTPRGRRTLDEVRHPR